MVFKASTLQVYPLQEPDTHDWHLENVSWKLKFPPIYLRYNENVTSYLGNLKISLERESKACTY